MVHLVVLQVDSLHILAIEDMTTVTEMAPTDMMIEIIDMVRRLNNILLEVVDPHPKCVGPPKMDLLETNFTTGEVVPSHLRTRRGVLCITHSLSRVHADNDLPYKHLIWLGLKVSDFVIAPAQMNTLL